MGLKGVKIIYVCFRDVNCYIQHLITIRNYSYFVPILTLLRDNSEIVLRKVRILTSRSKVRTICAGQFQNKLIPIGIAKCARRRGPVSILYKSIADRYRPVGVVDGPRTARYRFLKNAVWASWIKKLLTLTYTCWDVNVSKHYTPNFIGNLITSESDMHKR